MELLTLVTVLVVLVAPGVLLSATSIRMVQQYQRGVVLRFGRLLPEVRRRTDQPPAALPEQRTPGREPASEPAETASVDTASGTPVPTDGQSAPDRV